MAEERDYSSPYDEQFDAFFASGYNVADDGKTRLPGGEARQDRTLSWARNSAAKYSSRVQRDDGSTGAYNRTNVYGAFRFWWSKEEGNYYIPTESLEKMAQILLSNGYGVTEPEE